MITPYSPLKTALITAQCVTSALMVGITLYALTQEQGLLEWGGWIVALVFILIAICITELAFTLSGTKL